MMASKIVPRPGGTIGTGARDTGRIISNRLRDSAEGEQCTLQIAGVCNHRTDTTVLCHLPDESHGMARKSDDICAVFGCAACHDAIDGRAGSLSTEDRLFYMRRAMVRTWRRWIALGLVRVAK